MTALLRTSDLLRIEAWAMQGLSADNIAVLLAMSPMTFHELTEADPRVRESMLYGRTKGIEAVSQSLFGSAISGKDAGAARWWLERLGGGEFRPPKAVPVIIVEAAKPNPAKELECADRIDRMMQRQRLLVSGRDIDQDGNIIDLEPAVRKIPPSDDAEGGEV
jgi:hypothetical protein